MQQHSEGIKETLTETKVRICLYFRKSIHCYMYKYITKLPFYLGLFGQVAVRNQQNPWEDKQ